METKIQKANIDWEDVRNVCRLTVNKNDVSTEVSTRFKEEILISEHSPIRMLQFKWRWEGIKSWITVHFARHWLGWEKWISTQRNDRTGIDRNASRQDTLVNMDINANVQSLINVARVRLCNQAHKETRNYMEDLKRTIHKIEPEIAHVLVPNCIYRCGCPEFNDCGYYTYFVNKYSHIDFCDIKDRYYAYNKEFFNEKT